MAPKEEDATMHELSTTAGSRSVSKSKKQGYHLRWSRIEKVVDVQRNDGGLMGRRTIGTTTAATADGKSNTDATASTVTNTGNGDSKKVILKSVSGYAAPGQVLAVMGPSGSGKTSLMNVLSGRSVYQNGCISINGERLTPITMKRHMADIAYVKQADIFFGHLTVRDQLTYTALLRLSNGQDKHAEVNRVLKLLRLLKVADSPINMLSGGEKKRVNISTELLTDPAVFVLDEPTSGLDSTSAVALLKLLQTLAVEHGKTVLTTIHQPSSAVFRSFDRLLLLSEGSVVYFGTPVESLQYLRTQHFDCPDGYNAADHWMDLLVQDSSVIEEEEEEQSRHSGKTAVSSRLALEQAWDHEAVAEDVDRALIVSSDAKTAASSGGSEQQVAKYNTNWWTQYCILTHRALKNSRSAIFTPLNLLKSLAIGLVAGLVWFQTDYTENNVYDIQSYYFFTMTFWVFDAMFSALLAFPAERDVILKERASASYHLSAYFMAKTTADAPVRLILPLIYMTVSFWMAGISSSFSVFCGTVGCTLLSVLSGEALGLLLGAAVYDMEKAITLMTVLTLFLMLLGGFFVENVPSFIAWGKFLSPFKYAFDSSLQLVFDRDVPCDGSGALEELCNGGDDTGSVPAAEVRDFIGVQGTVRFNVGVLLLLSFIPRYFAYLALRMKKGSDRS